MGTGRVAYVQNGVNGYDGGGTGNIVRNERDAGAKDGEEGYGKRKE